MVRFTVHTINVHSCQHYDFR